MSRTSISWGIPLPWDRAHVAYVWFDALFNYCTAVGYGDDRARFDRYWPADYHLIGKDILRHHAVYWPAMLMAAGEAPPKRVFAHGYLLVGGEKMSKTRANQIAPADLVAEFGVDGFRYHFLADQRFGPDGDFSYEAMVARYNADLANNFGNLANRVLNMAVNYCDGVVPDTRADGPLVDAAATAFGALTDGIDELDYSSGFGAVWDLIRATNSYIEDRQPWALNKAGDAAAAAAVLGDCLEALRVVALLASPVIPRAAGELWRRLGLAGTPEDAAAPRRGRRGARLPAGRPAREGRAALPPHRDVTGAPTGWVDSHCHLPMRRGRGRPDAAIARARAAGVDGAGLRGHRPRRRPAAAVELAGRHPDVRATVGLHPHDASPPRRRVGRRSSALARDPPRSSPDRRGRLRPPLRALAARRAGGRVPRPDRSSRTSSTARS